MPTIIKVPRAHGVSWKAIIKRRGRVLKTKTFKTKTAAREWAKRIESNAELAEALDDPGREVAFSKLAELYLVRWNGRDHHRVFQVDWWARRLGDRRLSDVDPRSVRSALGEYAGGGDREPPRARAPASVNRLRAALSSLFTFAIREGLASRNPVKQVAGLPERNKRLRYLGEAERIALLRECRRSRCDRLYLLVLMAMMTGARKGELKALRWENVDFKNRQIRLERTKNDDPRILSLPPPVVIELMRWRKPGGLIFESARWPGVPFDEKKPWQAALEAAGVDDFRFHDLRHTAASYLAMGGASLVEIADVLGHRSLQTTHRYTHLSAEHKRKLTDAVFGGLEL